MRGVVWLEGGLLAHSQNCPSGFLNSTYTSHLIISSINMYVYLFFDLDTKGLYIFNQMSDFGSITSFRSAVCIACSLLLMFVLLATSRFGDPRLPRDANSLCGLRYIEGA